MLNISGGQGPLGLPGYAYALKHSLRQGNFRYPLLPEGLRAGKDALPCTARRVSTSLSLAPVVAEWSETRERTEPWDLNAWPFVVIAAVQHSACIFARCPTVLEKSSVELPRRKRRAKRLWRRFSKYCSFLFSGRRPKQTRSRFKIWRGKINV